MLRKFLLAVLVLTSVINFPVRASDNLAYIRGRRNILGQTVGYTIGTFNGATFKRGAESLLIDDILQDLNNKYMLFSGDFDKNGRQEICYVYNDGNSNQAVKFVDVASGLTSTKTTVVTNQNIDPIIFASAGDFNGDGKDELCYVFNNSDGVHQSVKVIDPSHPDGTHLCYIHLVDRAVGNVVFISVGDFDGLGTDELNYIYRKTIDGSYHSVTISLRDVKNLMNDRLLEDINDNANILFTNVGDFNNDGKDELCYVFNNSNGVHQSVKVIDASTGQLLCYIHLTDRGINPVLFINVGDFDGNGKDELSYIYKSSDGSSQFAGVRDLESGALLYTNTGTELAKYSSDGRIIFSNAGDFDGDGKDELCYIYNYAAGTFQTEDTRDLTNGNLLTRNHLLQISEGSLNAVIPIGPIAKYISSVQDRNFKPIPISPNLPDTKTFYLGWYSNNLDGWAGEALDRFPINGFAPSYLQSFSSTPYYADECKSRTEALLKIMSDKTKAGSKSTLINIDKTIVADATVLGAYSPINKNFSDYFYKVESLGSNYNIGGYFIDEPINTEVRTNYSKFSQVHTEVNVHGKYLFIDENWYRLKNIFDPNNSNNYSNGTIPFDIPMIENYIYKDHTISQGRTFYQMMNIALQLEDVRDKFTQAKKPGYIYIAQAHGNSDPAKSPEHFEQRAASWRETRYDVYNAIIHGAGGIFFWWVPNSDPFYGPGPTFSLFPLEPRPDYLALPKTYSQNVLQNVQAIMREITGEVTGGYLTPRPESMLQALMNEPMVNSGIFCSKDGYDQDYDTYYTGVEDDAIPPADTLNDPSKKLGREMADFNYIIRKDNMGAYYIIAVNNSKLTIYDVKYFIPSTLLSGKSIYEIKVNSDGTVPDIPTKGISSYKKRGKDYFTFNEKSISPFEVKIYKIGTKGLPKQIGIETPEKYLQPSSSVKSYELNNCYPNPFNPATIISYSLPKEEHVKITVFNDLGQKVAELVNEVKQPGTYKVEFNATNYPSGIYFYQIIAGTFSETKKMILMK